MMGLGNILCRAKNYPRDKQSENKENKELLLKNLKTAFLNIPGPGGGGGVLPFLTRNTRILFHKAHL